jgi:coenzyme F420-reducing hydrogenase gamma subunit
MQRNSFTEDQKKAIQPIIERFSYGPTVRKVSDVVTVDATVPGCPMDETAFLTVLDKYLKEFGVNE